MSELHSIELNQSTIVWG